MNIPPPDTLGYRIRRLRRAADLTMQDLAKRAGCHQQTIYELESNGNQNPTLGTLRAVATALGTTEAQLLDGVKVVEENPSA